MGDLISAVCMVLSCQWVYVVTKTPTTNVTWETNNGHCELFSQRGPNWSKTRLPHTLLLSPHTPPHQPQFGNSCRTLSVFTRRVNKLKSRVCVFVNTPWIFWKINGEIGFVDRNCQENYKLQTAKKLQENSMTCLERSFLDFRLGFNFKYA